MKSLLLLRHAEAVNASGEANDAARPLTAHGHAQAAALGAFLGGRGIVPDRIVTSAATRARETSATLVRTAGWPCEPTVADELYNASTEAMLECVATTGEDVAQLLLVAHAPGVPDLVNLLVTDHLDASFVCAPATFIEVVLDIDAWSGVRPACGALRVLLPA